MADYQSSYTGAQVDASVAFGHDPDTEPHLNSQAGVTSDGIYQADRAVEAKIVNRNLLDNPYFRIDQRQGQIAPPNTNYYSDTALTTLVGQTSEYVTVTAKASGYNTINIGGTDYYVAVADCVRGYVCGAGLTRINDRWAAYGDTGAKAVWLNNADGSVTIKKIANATIGFYQTIANEEVPKVRKAGKIAISSNSSGGNINANATVPSSGDIFIGNWAYSESGVSVYLNIVSDVMKWTINCGSGMAVNTEITISANKLELGSISTLQAEIDSGAYDEDLDLWECQYYLQPFELEAYLSARVWGNGSSADVVALLPLKRTMRLIQPTLQWVSGNVHVFWESSAQWNLTPTTTLDTKTDNIAQIYIPLSPATLDMEPATAWFNNTKFFLSAEP